MNNNFKLDIKEMGMCQKLANMCVWDIFETHYRKPSYETKNIKCAFNSQKLCHLDIKIFCSLSCFVHLYIILFQITCVILFSHGFHPKDKIVG